MISNSETIPASASLNNVSTTNNLINPLPLSSNCHDKSCASKPVQIPPTQKPSSDITTKLMFSWCNPVTEEKCNFESVINKYKAHIKLILNANGIECNSTRIAEVLAPLIPAIGHTEPQTFYEHNGKLFDSLSKAEGYRISQM